MAGMEYLRRGGQEKQNSKDNMPRSRRHVPKGTQSQNGD